MHRYLVSFPVRDIAHVQKKMEGVWASNVSGTVNHLAPIKNGERSVVPTTLKTYIKLLSMLNFSLVWIVNMWLNSSIIS